MRIFGAPRGDRGGCFVRAYQHGRATHETSPDSHLLQGRTMRYGSHPDFPGLSARPAVVAVRLLLTTNMRPRRRSCNLIGLAACRGFRPALGGAFPPGPWRFTRHRSR